MDNDLLSDIDPIETKEWLQSIDSVIKEEGIERAKFIINMVLKKIYKEKIYFNNKNYINTISLKDEPVYPGNIEIEKKICSFVRWNAVMIVLNASKKKIDLGGHIASFQSIADIYEVCFNHFFKASNYNTEGDIIYFQGHTSPGIYSRAFLEGRLTEQQLNNFRQEVNGNGLPSYPHPKLLPEFWQFPTVSMGLGPINAIYQAKFLKYLNNRNLKNTKKQTVYAFIGDGEMDEPESKGAINIAYREKLDNLIFIINCNLQRLDGPVIGNGKIINELENIFKGSGWEVIKVIWGDLWDDLFKKDNSKKLIQLVNETLDGDYQTLKSKDGAYIRKNFFGKYNETKKLVKNMSDNEIFNLNRGGHDIKKIYAAIKKAKSVKFKPVVILFHTIKGYSMGLSGESINTAHQIKNMNIDDLNYFKERLNLNNINDQDIKSLKYISFEKNSDEYNYLHERRKYLNGYIPSRLKNSTVTINLPSLKDFSSLFNEQKKNISTTIAFVRILNILLKNKFIKDKIVPIIADEARTFGMEGLFRQIGIYNSKGQNYTPQDKDQIAYYREYNKGQILQEGINELGAASSWLAAATSYSTNNLPIIPFYIYYSIFGFQRVGDLFWASGDQQARGFLIGATSGRTTLNGEGLQHEDGHSHIHSLTIPNCVSYDPAYAYEMAVIVHDGLIKMYGKNPKNIYYYITTTNENYFMPAMPDNIEKGIIKGIYKLKTFNGNKCKVQLMGSGSILKEIIKAAKILSVEFDIKTYVYSVTSFTELARNGQDCDRWNLLHPNKKPKKPFLTKILNNAPIVASTDYMKIYAEQIRKFIPSKEFHVLGTDGFGLSDSRKNLRNHFEIDKRYIVIAALNVLYKNRDINSDLILKTIKKFGINSEKNNPRL
ncbi:MAG: pyruvate dehydrogenase (acetyl-transferring), homodimeric type [Candidatus Makana argininalis]